MTEPVFRRDRIVSSSGSIGASDDVVLVDASGGAVTLTPPPATSMRGRSVTVVKMDATANAVTFDPTGAETVNGAATDAQTTQYSKRTYSSVLTAAPNSYNWIITRS